MWIRRNLYYISGIFLLGYLAINDLLNPAAEQDVQMANPLLIAALIAGGVQVAKGVNSMFAASKQKKFAQGLSRRGTKLADKAWSERKDYEIPSAFKENVAMAKNAMYDTTIQDAMQRSASLSAGNVASQIARSASTSGQAAAGALAASQLEMQGRNQAALAGAQQRAAGLSAVMNANQALGGAQNLAYQYNTMLPFTLNYERGINLENQGIQGRVIADQRRAMAFADMMNGISSAAMTYGVNAPAKAPQKDITQTTEIDLE
jgi:hypothetical protein